MAAAAPIAGNPGMAMGLGNDLALADLIKTKFILDSNFGGLGMGAGASAANGTGAGGTPSMLMDAMIKMLLLTLLGAMTRNAPLIWAWLRDWLLKCWHARRYDTLDLKNGDLTAFRYFMHIKNPHFVDCIVQELVQIEHLDKKHRTSLSMDAVHCSYNVVEIKHPLLRNLFLDGASITPGASMIVPLKRVGMRGDYVGACFGRDSDGEETVHLVTDVSQSAILDYLQTLEQKYQAQASQMKRIMRIKEFGRDPKLLHSSIDMSRVFCECKSQILQWVNRFADKQWYLDRALPHHLGLLFSGLPGTSKTSMIKALARYTNRDLYWVDCRRLTSKSMLEKILVAAGDKYLVVFEDFDRIPCVLLKDMDASSSSLDASSTTTLASSVAGRLEETESLTAQSIATATQLTPTLSPTPTSTPAPAPTLPVPVPVMCSAAAHTASIASSSSSLLHNKDGVNISTSTTSTSTMTASATTFTSSESKMEKLLTPPNVAVNSPVDRAGAGVGAGVGAGAAVTSSSQNPRSHSSPTGANASAWNPSACNPTCTRTGALALNSSAPSGAASIVAMQKMQQMNAQNMQLEQLLQAYSTFTGPKEERSKLWEEYKKAFRRVSTEELDELDLAAFLNVLDGVNEYPDRFIIFTANHPERIEPALLRPGRIDDCITFREVTCDVIAQVLRCFFQLSEEQLDALALEKQGVRDYVITHAELYALCRRHNDVQRVMTELAAMCKRCT